MPRGRKPEFNRDEVLAKAKEVFYQNGYRGAGMHDLLDHMGIARQSLYRTFHNKRQLFLEALETYRQEDVQPVIDILQGNQPPLERLQSAFSHWHELSRQPDHQGCLFGKTLAELDTSDPELNDYLKGAFRGLENAFCNVLREAVQRGDLRDDTNPRALARTLVTVAQGLALVERIMDSSFVEDVFTCMTRMVTQYLSQPEGSGFTP